MSVPIPTPIYHITHVDNLGRILSVRKLSCCAHLRTSSIVYRDVANAEIQGRRESTPVRAGPGGMLHDYVPFYFAPRSPMLYKIHKDQALYADGQRAMIPLVAIVQHVYPSRPCVFTDGHAIMALSEFFEDLAALDRVDWPVMAGRYWNDTQEAPDRKRRRQAEFLIHKELPWALITEIGVADQRIAAQVSAVLTGGESHRPAVSVRPDWYF